jgi:sugar/nucleoside kinase (ribokinase family)
VPAELFEPQSLLHLSGYALFTAGSRPAAFEALALARAAGCPISVDTASAAPLAGVGPELFLSWVGAGVLVFANRDEAHVLTGSADATAAALTLGQCCGEAIVKCGADAAVWSDGTDVVEVPVALSVAIDSTGAGDAFAAGVLAARVAGCDVQTALGTGHALAAHAIAHVGGRPTA